MSIQLPLQGVRIVEFEGIGPGPVAGRMLAAMGAEVTVIARPNKAALFSSAAPSCTAIRCARASAMC